MSEARPNSRQELQPAINQDEALVFHPTAIKHLGRLASGIPISTEPNATFEQGYRDSVDAKREQLLSLEQDCEGINFGRIDAYRKKMSAPNKAILFLNPDNYAKAKAIMGKKDFHEHGLYDPVEDVALVLRDPETEDLNGIALTEAAAVHELAHSTATLISATLTAETHTTGLFRKKTEVTLKPALKRTGFMVVHSEDKSGDMHGSFLEEGYAGYEQGEYVRELGNESGAISDHPMLMGETNPYKGTPLERFATIQRSVQTGELGVAAGMQQSVPAATLEQLFNHDPELLPLIRESRKSLDALREVPKRINAAMPGLYERMKHINVKAPDGIMQATQLMVEVHEFLDTQVQSEKQPASAAS